MSVPPALSIQQLGKSYGSVEVLKDISVSIEPGAFLVLVGPSGCGKSTLLNCIAGLEEVSSGSISIAGRDVTQEPPRDRNIAMVFQSYALYPTMSVAENIGFGMKIRKEAPQEIQRRTQEVAQLLQIEPLLERYPRQLSGGQRQRVAMGRALVRDPELFLFDEPLSNLDAKLRVEMRAEIKRLHQRTKTSIVYVTHDQVEAMTLATKIVVLHNGIIQQVGTPAELYAHPANTFVADFMGSPPMNLIPAHLSDAGVLHFRDGIQQPLTPLPPALQAYRNQNVIVGIRPEHFQLATPGQASLSLEVTLVENTGADAYLSLDWGTATAIARLPGQVTASVGESLAVHVPAEALSFFDPATTARIDAA